MKKIIIWKVQLMNSFGYFIQNIYRGPRYWLLTADTACWRTALSWDNHTNKLACILYFCLIYKVIIYVFSLIPLEIIRWKQKMFCFFKWVLLLIFVQRNSSQFIVKSTVFFGFRQLKSFYILQLLNRKAGDVTYR